MTIVLSIQFQSVSYAKYVTVSLAMVHLISVSVVDIYSVSFVGRPRRLTASLMFVQCVEITNLLLSNKRKPLERLSLLVCIVIIRWRVVNGKVNWTTSTITLVTRMVVSLRKWSVLSVGRWWSEDTWPVMLRLSVHTVRLSANTAMIQENISLLRANIRRSVPSFPYPVPTSVRLRVFLVKIWWHTEKNASWRS